MTTLAMTGNKFKIYKQPQDSNPLLIYSKHYPVLGFYNPDQKPFVSTLTLDLETWFKVTAYPLTKGSVEVKFKPGSAKRKQKMPLTSDFSVGWTDDQTEKQTKRPTDR